MFLRKLLLYMFAACIVVSCTNDFDLYDVDALCGQDDSGITVSVAPFVKVTGTETRAKFLDVTDNEEYLLKFVPDDRFGIFSLYEDGRENVNIPLGVKRQFFSNTGLLSAKCTLEGSLEKDVKYVIYYPYNEDFSDIMGKFLKFGAQVQTGVNNGDYVANNTNYFLSDVFTYNGSSLPKNITLNPLNSVVKIVANNLPSGKYSRIEMEDVKNDYFKLSFYSDMFYNITTDGLEFERTRVGRIPSDDYDPWTSYAPIYDIGSISHSLALQLNDCEINDNETCVFYLTAFPRSTGSFRIKATNEDGDIFYSNECFVLKMLAGYGYELVCSFQNHEFVDLGLPSGTKWATCNLGAQNEYDYGSYIKWGDSSETSIEDSHATKYVWSQRTDVRNEDDDITYDEWNSKWDGKWNEPEYPKYTKYCTNTSFGRDGFVDNKKILDEEDDIVKKYWGKGWSMPTHAQQIELLNNCRSEWTSNYKQTGKAGMIYTSKKNGKNIFFPAAGYLYKGRKENYNFGGYYFSKEMASSNHTSCIIFFRKNRNSNSAEYNSAYYTQYRDVASSIRPVCK